MCEGYLKMVMNEKNGIEFDSCDLLEIDDDG